MQSLQVSVRAKHTLLLSLFIIPTLLRRGVNYSVSASPEQEVVFTPRHTNISEIILNGVEDTHTLVKDKADVKTEVYGYVNLPIVLKREDTFEWLPVNGGELKIQQILRNLLASTPVEYKSNAISSVSRGRGATINIGAHECFFCVIFMLSGYRVYAVEPLPLCVSGIQETFSLYPRQFVRRVSLYNNYVSDVPIAIDTPINTCSGTFHSHAEGVGAGHKIVSSIALDDIPLNDDDVEILAIDTEGNELSVLSSGMRIFRTKTVKNVFFEYTAVWYRERTSFSLHRAIELMEEIIRLQGYKCYLLLDFVESISDTEELDIGARLERDWNAKTTDNQTDIYCTRCKHWFKVNPLHDASAKAQVTELCSTYS